MTTDYKISICYFTYRPGGFDLLIDSLERQEYKNYELIVIDDYPGRNLQRTIEKHGIPVRYYGPMKPKSIVDTDYGQCNAVNTALMYATGEIFLVLNDYTYISPITLKKLNDSYNKIGLSNIIVCVGAEMGYGGKLIISDLTAFEPPFKSFDSRFGPIRTWIPSGLELFCTAFSTEYLIDINGFDERADDWCISWWHSVLKQAKLNNVNIVVDHTNSAIVIDHRTWNIKDSYLWSIYRTGRGGPSQEFEWLKVSPNKFNIKEMRQKVRVWKKR